VWRGCETDGVTDGAHGLLAPLAKRPPADRATLGRLVEAAGLELPDEYLAFMASSDGGEGDIGERWVEIWPVDRVLAGLESESHYAGVVLFAGDGANTVYGFDRLRGGQVVEGDWIGLSRDDVIPHGPFADFLAGLARTQE
jgi:hypothetical protein